MEEKEFNLIVEETEKSIKKDLSCYIWKEQCAYNVTRLNTNEFVLLMITPTDLAVPFITSSAVKDVQNIYETNEWKEYMYYGIETYIHKDLNTGKEITLPCISVHISKKKL